MKVVPLHAPLGARIEGISWQDAALGEGEVGEGAA